jgi:phospholipid N-methyltransferase
LWTDYRVFWREFRQHYHTTGAIAPSGRPLAAALTRFVTGEPRRPRPKPQLSKLQPSKPQPSESQHAHAHPGPARRILEVGPGTGAVTTALVRGLRPDDSLDLVELNASFVQHLRQRFEREPAFRSVGSRSRVLHQPLETLPPDASYDLIISGLPLNNFSVPAVEEILTAYRRLLRPGGTLSFFEYIAIRHARSLVSGRAERARLQGISRALAALFAEGRIARDWVWSNLPPAWVHHVRLPPGQA